MILRRVGMRWLLAVCFMAAASYPFVGKMRRPQTETAGKLIAAHAECPFRASRPAEVLSYGLEDPRGVTLDPENHRVLIADGPRRRLVSYSIAQGGYQKFSPSESMRKSYCPEDTTETEDLRGLMMLGENFLVAEHNRARIAEVEPSAVATDNLAGVNMASPLEGASGIAFDRSAGTAAILTSDEPPRTAVNNASATPAESGQRRRGALYSSGPFDCGKQSLDLGPLTTIASDIAHPSGVALSPDGTLYVVESSPNETRWLQFRRQGANASQTWQRFGVLASVKTDGAAASAFYGIAVSRSGKLIYAAGPGGLYAFSSNGGALGRIEFLGAVTGVAWGTDEKHRACLYVAVSHSLCRVWVKASGDAPNESELKAAAACGGG
jgi:glucose/arabinose dehydrogenase